MNQNEHDIQRKLRILGPAEVIGRVTKTCRYTGIGRSTFYRWKVLYVPVQRAWNRTRDLKIGGYQAHRCPMKSEL